MKVLIGLAALVCLAYFVIWLFLRDARSLRRQRALLRQKCPECGYDLRAHFDAGLDRCPECGTHLESLQRGEWR